MLRLAGSTPQDLDDQAYASPGAGLDFDATESGSATLFICGSAVIAASQKTPAPAAASPLAVTSSSTPSSARPAWISQISTPSIAADMSAAISNGAVTYSGLLTLLTDLESSLSSSHSTLTATEFSDLKTIAANLNNGGSSPYLAGIMNALVNGNAANSSWTGGNSSSAPLGNLAAGSTATQLSELIGKWFLGTDLPSSYVYLSGTRPFSVTYSASSSPVFGGSGPTMNDINQGYLGDCYLLSSLAEVAYLNSGVISSMITQNGNNTYGVRFYIDGVADYVTVNSALADSGNIFNYGTDIWASLVEKAYAQLQAGGVTTGNSQANFGNSWSTIGNGGLPAFALEEITDSPSITVYSASRSSWTCEVYNSSLSPAPYTPGESTNAVQAALVTDLKAGDDLILSSNTNASDSAGKQTLVADHAMSIYGYDADTGMLQIRNPWGTMSGQYWDTTFEVSLTTLLAAGDTITADSAGTKSTIAPPVVISPTATQTWKLGQQVNFTLPSTTFSDPQCELLTYTATQSNGSGLPSWLSFNASTETFTGTVPDAATGLSITVKATDTSGLSASETFSVLTPASAPIVTWQTAPQTWRAGQQISFALPSYTFTDPQGERLTYTAAQANGQALPSWLNFNATTETFTGTAPSNATSSLIKVTATDTSGLSASETFSVSIAASLVHAIAQANGLAAAPIVNLVQSVQGVPNPLSSPRS
jgi:hypothetical protein